MSSSTTLSHVAGPGPWRGLPALLAAALWALTAVALAALDGHVDIANLAMLVVLCSALSALCLPLWASMLASAAAMVAFNWALVPPRGSFGVQLPQHGVLLGAMLGVNLVIATLLASLRRRALQAQRLADHAEQARDWATALRDSPQADLASLTEALHDRIRGTLGLEARISSIRLLGALPRSNDDTGLDTTHLHHQEADSREGLWLCLRQSRAMGPGTGWHDAQPAWYLPWRARQHSHGASRISHPTLTLLPPAEQEALRVHLQSLCDQLGAHLAHAQATQAEQQAREQAQSQSVRNALLAAVSHDYRTPLATILSAASSLIEQADRLSPGQRLTLATTVHDQTRQLARLTDNTLQLARLDHPGVQLRLDWESAEDMVGAALNRVRQRDPQRRVRARLEPGLPLLRCDAVLLAQLLDNLIDNALAYSPSEAPVELLVRRQANELVLAVRDRGPGVPPAQRDQIFTVFQRGEAAQGRGAGVGLAVCRAIATAHGGTLKLRARAHGGSSFEAWLPVPDTPAQPSAEAHANTEGPA